MLHRLRKLKTMSAREMLSRASTELHLRFDRIRHSMRGSGLTDEAFLGRVPVQNAELLLEHMRTRKNVRFYFNQTDKDPLVATIREHWPGWISDATRKADSVCDHEFSFLGISATYGEQINWTADPVGGNEWPAGFHSEIDIFSGRGACGDVKHVWELNRHQFFVDLGRAFFLTGDEKYARELFAQMHSWIDQNPYKTGINWTSGLEVAVRAISWIWAYVFCLHSRSMDARTHLAILKSIYLHGDYLSKHLSVYFSPYNHLVGETAALSMIGGMFPEFRESGKWSATGWTVLEREVGKQFHPDGFTVEQASFYHHFTLGFYLLAALLRRSNGEPVEAQTWELLEKATEISMHMARPDGRTPMIGDADDARSIYIANPPLWDFRAFYSTGAVLFSRGDMKKLAREFHEDSLWLLGLEGLREYTQLEEYSPRENSRAFRKSGYYLMRTGWDEDAHSLSLDCGPLADGVPRDDVPSAAHGHADALSVEASVRGRPVLVDPGFYTYNGAPDWHNYFRETRAHNTLVLDDRSQAKNRGRLKWSCAPRTEVHGWMSSRAFDYVDGSHDGYRSLTDPGIHGRAVVFVKPDYWLIRDTVTGRGEHQLDRYFHFAPLDVECDAESGTCRTRSSDGANLAIVSIERDGVTTTVIESGEAPEEGWLATGYGERVRAPVVRYRSGARLPATLHTLLIPFDEQVPEMAVDVQPLEGEQGHVVTIRHGGARDLLVFCTTIGQHRFDDGWQTDARAAFVRLDDRDRVQSCAIVDGSTIGSARRTLLKADKRMGWAALSLEAETPLIELSEEADVSCPYPEPRVTVSRG